MDRLFADPSLAELYDAFCAGRRDFDFYLPLVMSAQAVLDVGCGTGALLHLAREAGHTGRLCGLDPADAMLDQARRRSDIEWVLGDLSSTRWQREFDLVVMTGHAFQVLVTDEQVRAALAAVRSALTEGGQFGFETRNPPARAWTEWTPDRVTEVTDRTGEPVRSWRQVETTGGLVRFTVTYASPAWDAPKQSQSTLRFLALEELSAFLSNADLAVDAQYGDWDRQPLTGTSPEIITLSSPRATVK